MRPEKRQGHPKCSSYSCRTAELYTSTVQIHQFTRDGQSDPAPSTASIVHLIEPFEDFCVVFDGNSHSLVSNLKNQLIRVFEIHKNRRIIPGKFDGVGYQVEANFLQSILIKV